MPQLMRAIFIVALAIYGAIAVTTSIGIAVILGFFSARRLGDFVRRKVSKDEPKKELPPSAHQTPY
jgi:hypothetical protein